MFYETGGTFKGTPEINTTYYLSSDNMVVHDTEVVTLREYVGSMIEGLATQEYVDGKVPDGGTTGQILKKTETGTEWADAPQTVTIPETTALLKGDGSGGLAAATRGSDYIASGNIVKQTLVASESTPTENYAINWVYG